MSTQAFYLLLAGLAAYRLSLLISKEDGPAYIFRKLRNLPPPKSSSVQLPSHLQSTMDKRQITYRKTL